MSRSSQGFSGSRTTAIAKPRSRTIAQALVDDLNGVLNRTVSDARLALVDTEDDDVFTITRIVDQALAPLDLSHGLSLLVQHTVAVAGGQVRTVSYSYRLQAGNGKGDWLLRWEYEREPPNHYPPAHVHSNASFHGSGEGIPPLKDLHVATARVAFELVLWHLIADWQIEPKTPDWREILRESWERFEHTRTH
jgi:hypothetical protein